MLDDTTIDLSFVRKLPPEKKVYVDWQARWSDTARPNQIPQADFSEYGFMAGRGFGKTRIGAEWQDAHGGVFMTTLRSAGFNGFLDIKPQRPADCFAMKLRMARRAGSSRWRILCPTVP